MSDPVEYIQPVVDTSTTTRESADFFGKFFAAKNRHDIDLLRPFFSEQLVTYTDTTLGLRVDGYTTAIDAFTQMMPGWGAGRSYPVRIYGSDAGAIVEFTDTAELFSEEIHLLGAVDIRDGRIVRWADYWDSSGWTDEGFAAVSAMGRVGTDYASLESSGSGSVDAVARALQSALSAGDADAAAELFSYDAVLEDRAARTSILGRSAISRYLTRALAIAPWGSGSRLHRTIGGERNGGHEWFAEPSTGVLVGVTALTLDEHDRIARLVTSYDGRRLGSARQRELALAALDR